MIINMPEWDKFRNAVESKNQIRYNAFIDESGEKVVITLTPLKKTLSDKAISNLLQGSDQLYVSDVKEALHILLSNLDKDDTKQDTYIRAEKIFGDMLL